MDLHTETLPTGLTFPMRLIPGGTFEMGSPDTDPEAAADEKPQHRVQITPFYMAPYAVTQALWKAVMGEENNPSEFKGDQHPVENVSWLDVQEFIQALNSQTNVSRQNLGLGYYRLPTEAEWEYAARGGPANSCYQYAGSDKLKEVGWYEDNSDSETREVGLLLPNQLGLYDMSGNVEEWCEDWYHNSYRGAPSKGTTWLSPVGSYRVCRGGSWSVSPQVCRMAYRDFGTPDNHFDYLGFRLAMTK